MLALPNHSGSQSVVLGFQRPPRPAEGLPLFLKRFYPPVCLVLFHADRSVPQAPWGVTPARPPAWPDRHPLSHTYAAAPPVGPFGNYRDFPWTCYFHDPEQVYCYF